MGEDADRDQNPPTARVEELSVSDLVAAEVWPGTALRQAMVAVVGVLAMAIAAALVLFNVDNTIFPAQPSIALAQTNSYLILGLFVVGVSALGVVGLMRAPLFVPSLIRTLIWWPGAVAVATITVYLIFSPSGGDTTVGINAVVYGVPIGTAAWALYAYVTSYFSTARGANPAGYVELVGRAAQLAQRADADPAAITDLLHALSAIDARWVHAVGYVQAFQLLHIEEQRLLELAPTDSDALIAVGLNDRQRLAGAQMPNRDTLSAGLSKALAQLNPALAPYLGLTPNPKPAAASEANALQLATAARAFVCATHRSIEDFRDDRWSRVIRARNQLLATASFTGLVAFLGLAVALASGIAPDMLRFASAYYLAGAGVGLLAQLKISGSHTAAIEDYGLTVARLVQTPLLSGIAGLGGVLFVAATGHLVTGGEGTNLLTAFFSSSGLLGGILTSAVFGASPALFLNGLQQEANAYKNQLASTERSDANNAASGPASPLP